MKNFKFLAIIFTILILSLSFELTNVFAKEADTIKLFIDSKEVKTDVAPIATDNRVLVPVRSIFEKLGADVTWIGSRQQVIIRSLSNRLVLNLGSEEAYVDDDLVIMDVPPMAINGRTMIPVRFVSENLGYDVKWDADENAVHINTPKASKKNPIIQKVSVTKTAYNSKVVVSVKDMKRPTISYATDPMRFIADFPDATIYGGDSRKRLETEDITEVRYAEHEDYSRVVIETPADAEFSIRYTSDSMIVTVETEDIQLPEDDNDSDNDQTSDDEEFLESIKPSVNIPPIDKDNPIIVIDPGHGGWDTGAVAYDEDGQIIVSEADANLAIALNVRKYLEAEGVSVIMTRTTDIALGTDEMEDLLSRSAIANEVGAAFFVSIHNNSFSNDTATGTEILYVSGGVENALGITGEMLAENIMTPLVDATGLTNRGLKNEPKMVVLRATAMPAVLVECAFVSNPEDRKLLTNKKSLDNMGYAIASGILETLSEID